MSSPFKIFRKHQKLLLAVAGLMAMIAFVILPIVLQNFGERKANANPVVVSTTKYGDLKQSDMQNLRYRHETVLGVLSKILSMRTGYDQQQLHQFLEMRFGGSKEEESVNRWLMAHKAEDLGIQVSDDSITNFLKEQAGDKLTWKDFQSIFNQQQITQKTFYDMLREEMKAQQFQEIYSISASGATPAQRWDYYCRTHQQAKVECIPVAVEKFASEIPKPSDQELKDFFEKYKANLPSPASPEPGFRVPQKIEVEFFKAELEKFAVPENITEEEIQTYYQKDTEYYDKRNKESLMKEAEEAAAKKEPAEKKTTEKEGEKKESTEKAKPEEAKPAEGAKPEEAAKPAEEAKPADTTEKPAVPEGEKKEGEKKESEQPEPPATEKPADKAEEKSSSVERSPYRLVSLLTDDTPKPEEKNQPKTDTPAPTTETTAKTEPPATEPKPAETKPEEAKPADAKPASEAAAKEPSATTTEKAAAPKRQLSEDVRKLICLRIAEDKIKGVFAKIERLMNENAKEWKRYDSAIIRGETKLTAPPKFDFEGLAKQYGLTVGKTGEITKWNASDLDIGGSQPLEGGQPFFITAFDNLAKYSPVKSQDMKGDFFLYWKSKDLKETAPKWEDAAVQKQVLAAWQLVKAREPALEKAKKQRRIAQWREQTAAVRDDEDEEDDDVRLALARRVGAQQRPDQQHRGARGADPAREQRAESQQRGVDDRRARERSAHDDPAGDHEERAEQHDERDVLLRLLGEVMPPRLALDAAEVGDHGKREEERHETLVAIALPEMGRRQGQERDGEQQPREGQHRPERELGAEIVQGRPSVGAERRARSGAAGV
jgi:hypothetical protein